MASDNKPGKLGAHPLVQALNPDPSTPPERTVKLFGLPGASPTAGETRLWLDSDLTSYVDIPDDALLHSKELPDDAGTIVWVAADAKLTYGSVSSHATQAGFLQGEIAGGFLGGAAAAAAGPAGPMPTPPLTLVSACGPCASQPGRCVSLPFCPSEAMAPSHCVPCQSHPGTCPSLPLCPSEALAPSHCFPCVSHAPICPPPTNLAVCPSHPVVCPPSHLGPCMTNTQFCAPTHSALCVPSVHILCPTPTALFHCPSALCPSRLCPSVSVPCQTAQACPTAFCPPQSIACGGGGGFGPVA